MNGAFQFTANDTIKTFIIIVASVGIFFQILLSMSSYPFKKFISIMYKYPKLNLEQYYFYYQKATAYRMLYMAHILFGKTLKILSVTATFITVYCAVDNNDFILLFSLIAAMCEVILLSIPVDTYSKIYVKAARKLEYVLNNGDNIQEPELSRELNSTYQEAEEIIEKGFQ